MFSYVKFSSQNILETNFLIGGHLQLQKSIFRRKKIGKNKNFPLYIPFPVKCIKPANALVNVYSKKYKLE